VPALYSIRVAERLDLSVFQEARKKFWRSLTHGEPTSSWRQVRDDIYNAIPDSEDFGSLEAAFAADAALVAADIASFLEDRRDSHIIEAMQFAINSIHAYVVNQLGVVVFDRSIDKLVNAHPLMQKAMQEERESEEGDIAFLSALPDTPWSEHTISVLRHRAEIQGSLFDRLRAGYQAN
jgi:hypothetical protein